MSKRKIFLASILIAASLTATGCGGGGGGGSSAVSGGSSSVGGNTNSGNVGGVVDGFNTTTNLVVGEDKLGAYDENGLPVGDGIIDPGTEVPYYSARLSATEDTPPPVPSIKR